MIYNNNICNNMWIRLHSFAQPKLFRSGGMPSITQNHKIFYAISLSN